MLATPPPAAIRQPPPSSQGGLGLGDTASRARPEIVPGLQAVTQASASNGTIAIAGKSSHKRMYVCGPAANGALGRGPPVLGASVEHVLARMAPLLHAIPARPTHVAHVSAGAFHTVAVTETGAAFSWGMGSDGRYSTGHRCMPGAESGDHFVPNLIVGLSKVDVVTVSCGSRHNIALIAPQGTLRGAAALSRLAAFITQAGAAEKRLSRRLLRRVYTKRTMWRDADAAIGTAAELGNVLDDLEALGLTPHSSETFRQGVALHARLVHAHDAMSGYRRRRCWPFFVLCAGCCF